MKAAAHTWIPKDIWQQSKQGWHVGREGRQPGMPVSESLAHAEDKWTTAAEDGARPPSKEIYWGTRQTGRSPGPSPLRVPWAVGLIIIVGVSWWGEMCSEGT